VTWPPTAAIRGYHAGLKEDKSLPIPGVGCGPEFVLSSVLTMNTKPYVKPALIKLGELRLLTHQYGPTA